MAKFSTYGHVFEVPDRYSEGQALKANEATALNGLMAEMISHKVRAQMGLSKGQEPSAEQIAAAEALIAEQAESYEFGAGRVGTGTGRVQRDPVEAEAIKIARTLVKAKIKEAGLTLAKRDTEAGEGEYPFDAYEAKVEEVAQMDSVVAQAKKVVKAKTAGTDDLALSL